MSRLADFFAELEFSALAVIIGLSMVYPAVRWLFEAMGVVING